jgi:hypothetical protein
MEILDTIPFEPDLDTALSELHLERGSPDAKDAEELIEAACRVAKPKAIYDACYIEAKTDDTVTLRGTTFASRVLRVNLEKAHKAFPYVATCGTELDELDIAPEDLIRRFWLDEIKGMALGAAMGHLREHLASEYAFRHLSSQSPGDASHDLWPIEQQKELFSVFGDVETLIGVALTDSFLMIPNKSVSGIYFPTEVSFESCKLCPRAICPNRRAPFDRDLLASYKGGKD